MAIDLETGEILPERPARAVPFLRTAYNYDMDAASDESGLRCLDPSLAQQHMAEECDINTIVRRFGLTGELPDNPRVPQSGDFVDVVDYQTALNVVIAADQAFMELPADVRARFNNDPQKLMEFVSDSSNLEEARKLGLANAAPVLAKPEPMPVRIVPDVSQAGNSST